VLHEDKDSPKMSKPLFKSPHEQECFRQLRSIFKGTVILPNYPIKLFVDLSKLKTEFTNNEFAYLLKAYVDFAIFSREGKLLRVYEAQISKFHNNKNNIERDNLKKRLFALCEIEFVEIHGRYHESFIK
jgi:phage-related tail protein